MGTSKSVRWTATAFVFSGRVDPSWEVPPAAVTQLLASWEDLATGGSLPTAPPLGYRGVALSAPDNRTWVAYNGVVDQQGNSGHELKIDVGRFWERMLVNTAPEGTLPPIEI